MIARTLFIILLTTISSSAWAKEEPQQIHKICTSPDYPHIFFSMELEKLGPFIQGVYRLRLNDEDPALKPTGVHLDTFEIEQSDNKKWYLSHLYGLELTDTPNWSVTIRRTNIFAADDSEKPIVLNCKNN
mgnify:CR=1 FL=1